MSYMMISKDNDKSVLFAAIGFILKPKSNDKIKFCTK